MSTVYLAANEGAAGFRREVALKWVAASTPGYPELALHLLREARIVGQIRHPHVVQILDASESADGVFLVLEYVEGGTLAELVAHALKAGAPLPPPIALRIVCDALSGLHAAHELRNAEGQELALVHRDFSPHNILVSTEGDVKLGDFGIAKIEHTAHRTRAGLVKGTVSYMSPEQVRGQPLDRRSDLWSAAVVAWELFAGTQFHEQREAIATALSTLTGKIPRLRSARPELPQALDDALALALSRTPSRRAATALELRERLLRAAEIPMASTDELAAYARAAFAEGLAARRERLSEQPTAIEPVSLPAPSPARPGHAARLRSRLLTSGIVILAGVALALSVRRAASLRPSSASASATPSAVVAPPVQVSSLGSNEPATNLGTAPISSMPASSARVAHGKHHAHAGALGRTLAPREDARVSPDAETSRGAPPLADNPYTRTGNAPQ